MDILGGRGVKKRGEALIQMRCEDKEHKQGQREHDKAAGETAIRQMAFARECPLALGAGGQSFICRTATRHRPSASLAPTHEMQVLPPSYSNYSNSPILPTPLVSHWPESKEK